MKRARDLMPMIPQGVQCYFGEEVNRRRRVESTLAGIIKNWGFREIILPFFDYLEDFSYGLGSQLGDKAYRFLDRDGSLLALRPDLTTLVAKTTATRMSGQLLPIQLFYSGEVFRQERAGAGKQKEFYQIGLESMGIGEIWADTEVILIAIDCLLHLGITDFRLALGHVGFFMGLLSSLNLPPERAEAFRDAIDRKDCAWLEREVAGFELAAEKKDFLAKLPNFAGGRDVLDAALAVVQNPRARQALADLIEIHLVLDALGLADYVSFDLSEVRGLDYYSGMVFKIYGDLLGFELGGGGRYDGLLGKFGWDLPAVGFSFTLDRVLPLIGDIAGLQVPEHDSEEYVVAVEQSSTRGLFEQVWDMRRRGLRVQLGEAVLMLTVALSKGRLLEPSVTCLSRAGIQVPEDILTSRRLIAVDATGCYRFLLVKPTDLPTYVEYGVAVAGICGRDILLEAEPDVHQPLDLGFGRCRLVLAGPDRDTAQNHNLLSTTRVATKYQRVAERFFRSRGLPAEVIFLSGSVELAPNIGLAEMIVDLVETGRTLRENGLTIIEEIEESTARVIVNRAGFHIRHREVQEFLNRLRRASV